MDESPSSIMAGQEYTNNRIIRCSNKTSGRIPLQIFFYSFPGIIEIIETHVYAGLGLQEYQRDEYGKAKLSNARMKVGLRICAALELDPYEVVFENGRDMAGVQTGRD